QKLREPITAALAGMGLTLTQFYIENVSLPPEVEQALDTRTKMGVIGDLGRFTQYQTAEAIRDAAQNPSGLGGVGAGLGAGRGVGPGAGGRKRGGEEPEPLDRRRPAAAAEPGDVLRRREQHAGRPVRPGDAGGQGPRRGADAADAGLEAGDGRLGGRRVAAG